MFAYIRIHFFIICPNVFMKNIRKEERGTKLNVMMIFVKKYL